MLNMQVRYVGTGGGKTVRAAAFASGLPCLTIKQPWAHLITHGHPATGQRKTLETRRWKTNHRGVIGIHAGKATIPWAMDHYGLQGHAMESGAIVATANLTDCRPMVDGDQDAAMCGLLDDGYAWVLEDVHVLDEPIPVKGQLGLWRWRP